LLTCLVVVIFGFATTSQVIGWENCLRKRWVGC